MGKKRAGADDVPPVIHSLPPGASAGNWGDLRERMAHSWRLPLDDLDAALLLGLPDAAPPADLTPAARHKADETAAWAAAYLGGAAGDHLLLRRKLFRAVYCDWPGLGHILRWLAAHHARLFLGEANPATAEETRLAYVPVADMLGLWRVRRCWIEESMRRLDREGYLATAGQVGVADLVGVESDRMERVVMHRQRLWDESKINSNTIPSIERYDLDSRMVLYARLQNALQTALQDEFQDGRLPRVELIPILPGMVLYGAWAKGVKTEQWLVQRLPQLQLRIYCNAPSDCYRALGVIHHVAPPVRIGDMTRVGDYIATPQPNGYRALSTVCQWSAGGDDLRQIGCYLLTEEMHQLNEWGPMAAEPVGGWHPEVGLWRSLDRVSAMLKSRGERQNSEERVAVTYLRTYDLTGVCDPIYCFTPLGEIFPLREGSLPLDFAYRVHTQLGHRAARIEVNGREANLMTPLSNGDLVEVTFDAAGGGLNFDWQSKVRSKSSRAKIRAELRRRAAHIHEGRRLLEVELIHQLDLYDRDAARRGEDVRAAAPPLPSTTEINHFMHRAALQRGLGDPEPLYRQMETDKRLVGDLAHQLLSEKIIRALRPTEGQPARHKLARVELCPACRPTRNPIRVLLRASGREGDVVVIHRPGCRFASPIAPEISFEWAEQETPDDWPLFRFDISAPDHDGLLIQLLEIVRTMPHAYLFRVDASVNELNRAYVTLDVALRLPQSRGDLKHLIERAGAEVSYDYLPAEPRRSDVRVTDLSREMNNPFTRSHVTDWRFFNRDEITSQLTRWVYRQSAASPLMLIYGQRRVGKSSLVNRFFEKEHLVEYPNQRVRPVFVDFRLPDLSRPDTVADCLGRNINARLDLGYERPGPGEDPMVWLDGLLLAAQARLRNERLLLIIDEFDADLDRLMATSQRPRSLAALRAIMSSHPFIRWLLVVQDVYLADPQIQAALPDLPYSFTQLEVRHLERSHAYNLIRTLTMESGYQPEPTAESDGLFDQVVEWTAGNPFFIHLIGRELINSADAGGRKHITQADFFQALNVVLGRDGEFSHFTEHLAPDTPRRAITTFIAAASQPGETLPAQAVSDELVHRRGLMDVATARRTIDVLERLGIVATTRDTTGPRIGIPIRLFHKWLQLTWES